MYKIKNYNEVKDIIIAWIGISFCFTFALSDYYLLNKILFQSFSITHFLVLLGVSLIVTGTSFILHELAHKYTAIHFGAKAQFIKWTKSLVISVVLAFITGYVFVAPGAVYVFGKKLSIKEDGIVSLAGPALNIIMGFIFIGLGYLGLSKLIVGYGVFINFWIAAFNLIPFGPLDGKKIFMWNPFIWLIAMIIPLLFIFVL